MLVIMQFTLIVDKNLEMQTMLPLELVTGMQIK